MDERKYALLIIDMQNDFVLPGAPASVSGAYATIPCIRRLLDFFHGKNLPVFFVKKHRGRMPDAQRVLKFIPELTSAQ